MLKFHRKKSKTKGDIEKMKLVKQKKKRLRKNIILNQEKDKCSGQNPDSNNMYGNSNLFNVGKIIRHG